jgi:unsaturated rhamnogalacturonyl hydrolase
MTSLVDLSRATGDSRYRDYTQRWIDRHITEGYYVTTSDRCLPAAVANELYRTTCKVEYRTVNETVLKYLYEEARRTDDGGINHLGTSTIFPPTLWVDSLYMFGTVLIRWGEDERDTRALDEYGKQYGVFAKHLQDPSGPGFFVHGYNWGTAQDPNVYWARGNGWVLASGYDYLRVRPNDDRAMASLAKLAAAVVSTQDAASGLWWTVINRPGETYLETSASALFAAGLARGRRVGALDASVIGVVTKAIAGIRTKIKTDERGRPIVTGTSGPTNVGSFAGYAAVEVKDDLSYGVGAVILALVESSGLR